MTELPDIPALRWVSELDDDTLRRAYVEAVEWLYEQVEEPELLPIMFSAMIDHDLDGDQFATAILLEAAGRWVLGLDGET